MAVQHKIILQNILTNICKILQQIFARCSNKNHDKYLQDTPTKHHDKYLRDTPKHHDKYLQDTPTKDPEKYLQNTP